MVKAKKDKQGFSLVIVAGMIVVLTVVVMTFMETSGVDRKLNESRSTNQKLETIRDAMKAFHNSNGFLPCPARRDIAMNNSAYGQSSDCTVAVPSDITQTGTIRIGVVPTKTLGLSDAAGVDIWGRKLTYAVVTNLATIGSYGGTLGSITVNGDNPTSVAAFVVVSHGASGSGAKSREGRDTALTCGSTTLDAENCDTDATFTQNPHSVGIATTAANFYDDFIIYGLKF
jgi:hypothetical protein